MESEHYIQAMTINATFIQVAYSRCLLQNQSNNKAKANQYWVEESVTSESESFSEDTADYEVVCFLRKNLIPKNNNASNPTIIK